ncbi:MAG TPA: Ig-like domain-containing protein [Candidatus Dormibacteraeota bacterium]|nr:Ig-like domain-containing protein [Candidatus Dormibacteraeota bacterium]
MKTLERNRIDQLVRELETDAYRRAVALASEPAEAERILLKAFAGMATSLGSTPQTVELKERLHGRIRQLGSRGRGSLVQSDDRVAQAVVVSASLHTRIVDLLEEEQAVEPVGRRRAVLLTLGGVVLAGALAAFIWVRADALAAAQPTIADVNPPSGAKEVPLRGDFKIAFGRHPVGTPTLRLEPADGVLESPRWEGSTLVVAYSGLRLATRYQVVLGADYRSRFKDTGHLVKRWSFSAEGYPVLVKFAPTDGQAVVTRTGAMTIDFNHRPAVEPQVHIVPADASLLPGQWIGSTWTVGYAGLKPLTSYQVTAVVDYGVSAANIRRQWAFTTEPGAPPDGMPVIWYSAVSPYGGAASEARLVAIDWTGTMVGTVYQTPAVLQSPDGTILANRDGMYFDRTGATLRAASTTVYYTSALADDNRSLCEIRPSGSSVGEQWVFIGRPGGLARRVAQAGVIGGRSSIAILACSPVNDRVVLGDLGMTGLTSVRVIAISSGRVLYQRAYPAQSTSVISSHDGKYLAEQATNYDGQGQPVVGVTLIRRTVDGQVVGQVGKQRVLRFSWDDMRVVTGPFFAGTGEDLALIEWQTGKTLWRQATSSGANSGGGVFAMAQPSGPKIAIALGTHAGSGDVDQLWLVDAQGHATQVINEVFYPAINSPF